MATYVCIILCALYIIPIIHGRFIFFSTYIVFYVHCILALLGSKAQRCICEICSTNLASFLGFLGFFMDLLVQDSIWIYLFSLWPYGPIRSLLHCVSLWYYYTVEPSPHAQRARPVRSAGWGCSLLEVATTGNYSNIRRRSSSFYGSLGFILLLCFWSTATYYFAICCQFSSNFGLWIGGILAVTFGCWELCPVDTIYPLSLPQFYTFGLLMRMSSWVPLAWVSCFPLGSDIALECYLRFLSRLLPFLG